ncbi:hypothetical protein Tco_1540875 [Tanacetum coccineum]
MYFPQVGVSSIRKDRDDARRRIREVGGRVVSWEAVWLSSINNGQTLIRDEPAANNGKDNGKGINGKWRMVMKCMANEPSETVAALYHCHGESDDYCMTEVYCTEIMESKKMETGVMKSVGGKNIDIDSYTHEVPWILTIVCAPNGSERGIVRFLGLSATSVSGASSCSTMYHKMWEVETRDCPRSRTKTVWGNMNQVFLMARGRAYALEDGDVNPGSQHCHGSGTRDRLEVWLSISAQEFVTEDLFPRRHFEPRYMVIKSSKPKKIMDCTSSGLNLGALLNEEELKRVDNETNVGELEAVVLGLRVTLATMWRQMWWLMLLSRKSETLKPLRCSQHMVMTIGLNLTCADYDMLRLREKERVYYRNRGLHV